MRQSRPKPKSPTKSRPTRKSEATLVGKRAISGDDAIIREVKYQKHYRLINRAEINLNNKPNTRDPKHDKDKERRSHRPRRSVDERCGGRLALEYSESTRAAGKRTRREDEDGVREKGLIEDRRREGRERRE